MWNTPIYDTTKLTVELRELIENGVNIWDFEYPSFYTGEAKTAFEQKVIDHYYFRQIGQETVGRFKHYFRTRIREIMPYFIQMYESVELMNKIEDPFSNVDFVEEYNETSTSENQGFSKGSSTASSSDSSNVKRDSNETHNDNKLHKFSDTIQGSVQNLDEFLTQANENLDLSQITNETDEDATSQHSSTGSTEGESESTGTTTIHHTFTKKGNQGVNTFAHDMKELRQTFINVDMMVIESLNDLFLKVY